MDVYKETNNSTFMEFFRDFMAIVVIFVQTSKLSVQLIN